jgi:hypothetical protein
VCDRARPVVTLLIARDSPLAKGRLPKDASRDEAGIRAAFDPISYALLRASLGEFIPLQEVRVMFEEAIRKMVEQTPATSAEGPSDGEGAA